MVVGSQNRSRSPAEIPCCVSAIFASAFESFENATAFGSMIVHFAVGAALFLIVFVSAVSAKISLSMASFISSSSAPAMSSVVTVERGSS